MTETKFTPGPWAGKVDGEYQPSDWEANNDSAMTYEYAPVVDERGSTVCLVVNVPASFAEDSTKLDYNASLIAAAPDLLAACEAAEWNSLDLPDFVVKQLRDALAKARGES